MSISPTPRPRWSLRRKTLTAGAIGVLAVGFWLGTLLKGPGLGPGEGLRSASDVEESAAPSADVPTSSAAPSSVRPTPEDGTSATTSPAADAQPAQMIAVLIRGDGFGLLVNPPANVSALAPPLSQHFQPATLDEIIARARSATGNASGVKVQLVRHKSSTAGNSSALRTALRNSAVPDDAIHAYVDFHD